jgi:hypothetical protein
MCKSAFACQKAVTGFLIPLKDRNRRVRFFFPSDDTGPTVARFDATDTV